MDSIVPLRFSLEGPLGGLTRYLRLLGHDAAWNRGDSIETACARAREEGRILLVRSSGPAKGGLTPPHEGCTLVSPGRRLEQLVEVGLRWPIFTGSSPFTRCAVCNEPLLFMDPSEARSVVPPLVAETHDTYQTCPRCTRVFWAGSHTKEIMRLFREAACRSSQIFPSAAIKRSAGSEVSDPALPNG